ncbi:hypothetical protein BpHYR1_003660 [Brachionus plicatilis]|uniref:Uncharacterized protein n=1 Tax=Brachionus plicatilis TaxID=10195 RepID=A0A3M7PW30_BRAPC|nr:hypothetical protein BpHYR1_003660 [Brachionus plicatilis]
MIATITNTYQSINNESEIEKYLKQLANIFTEDIDILKWWDNNPHFYCWDLYKRSLDRLNERSKKNGLIIQYVY